MIYNNIFTFLIAIFLFSLKTIPKKPWPSLPYGLLSLCLILGGYWLLSGIVTRRLRPSTPNRYFTTERALTAAALFFYVVAINIISVKFYLQPLALGGLLPAMPEIGGLVLFFLFLIPMWLRLKPFYAQIFRHNYAAVPFVVSNIKTNAPIVLPWVSLSLLFDLLALLPLPLLQKTLASAWGNLLLYLFFILFLIVLFPPLVRWLWNCRPLPPSPWRERIVAFCREQGFHSEILIWPLFEGQVLTAAVLGFVPRLRYLMLTPALLATTSREEMNSILAHEIGHVKKKHLLLYLILLVSFSALVSQAAEHLRYFFLRSDLFYDFLIHTNLPPQDLLSFLWGIPLLATFLVYFRFVFAYYIRNFERQADLHVFAAMGSSLPLISAFEKIALLSGRIRDKKSWHHFGIGERIDFLHRCEADRTAIARHTRKLHYSLLAYFLVLAPLLWLSHQLEPNKIIAPTEIPYIAALVQGSEEPAPGFWLKKTGELMVARKEERRAISAYEKALLRDQHDAHLLNNLAWLLLTAAEPDLRNPARALHLARTAVTLRRNGAILDTLAVAHQANGQLEQAIAAEEQALQLDPANTAYYLAQLRTLRARAGLRHRSPAAGDQPASGSPAP